jgi:uracil-DNA glycosylase
MRQATKTTMITSFFKPKPKKNTPPASLRLSSSDSSATASTEASEKEGSKTKRPRTATTNDGPGSATAGGSPSSEKRTKKHDGNDPKTASPSLSDAVKDLISHLDADAIDSDLPAAAPTSAPTTKTWKSELGRHFSGSQFASLAAFVAAERKFRVVYPTPENTWTALNACPLSAVKVVVVGQDPYHGPNQAHGLSFSVARNQAVPPSLKNIYRELRDDPDVPRFDSIPSHGNLMRWAQQGVLMLNAVLTVRSGEPNSHAKRGWEATTDAILRAVVNRRHKDGDGGVHVPVVFLLWGKPALAKAQTVLASGIGGPSRQKSRHVVICTSHPSPLGATKTSSPFLGSRCFSRCNQALVDMGLEPIDWNVDGPL